jgi:hypothetical protein
MQTGWLTIGRNIALDMQLRLRNEYCIKNFGGEKYVEI